MSRAVVEKIHSTESPAEAFDKLSSAEYGFFLDGGMDWRRLGRYSFIGANPFLVFRSRGDVIELVRPLENNVVGRMRGNPFDVLELVLSAFRVRGSHDIPFAGGAVGYFSYDLKDVLYPNLPSKARDDIKTWDCYLGFYDEVMAYDNLKKKAYRISCRFGKRMGQYTPPRESPVEEHHASRKITSNFTKKGYIKAIEKAKEYISAGDIYQINLSQRFSAGLGGRNPWSIYKRLREINPAPFAAYLNFPDLKILSSSPERFLKVSGRKIETRPIKGTRPRGLNPREDRLLAKELKNSVKDKAEHVMIVDLERNDLGRICKYGSVRVPEFEAIETYPTVHHMVSTVEGRLRRGVRQVDVLQATFPGGSITGAPKVRAMEVIEELEPTKRSAYTGALGYLGFDGSMDLSIIIRTMIIKDGRIFFQAGGGIVADSKPEDEYQETLDKAKALLKTLENGKAGLL